MKKIIIAIDGLSATGKSTLAKLLAKKLHYQYIDSGAMYRAITYYFLKNNIALSQKINVNKALLQIKFSFQKNKILLNNQSVEKEIRSMEVANKVSEVATLKEVRKFAVAQQRLLAKQKGIVMDGRDIGTTVFPKAELKIFLTADESVRVKRRFEELKQKNIVVKLNDVKKNITSRDFTDMNRKISPVKKATEAIEINNSKLSLQQQLNLILKLAKEKIN